MNTQTSRRHRPAADALHRRLVPWPAAGVVPTTGAMDRRAKAFAACELGIAEIDGDIREGRRLGLPAHVIAALEAVMLTARQALAEMKE